MSRFAQSAMLANLSLSTWSGRKEDKQATAEVEGNGRATGKMGKFNKLLVNPMFLAPVVKAVSAARTFHYANTSPWFDEGPRLLSTRNYVTYKSAMVTLIDNLERAFSSVDLDAIKNDAMVRLRRPDGTSLYDPADYPEEVRSKYRVKLQYFPIPDIADIRLDIADSERVMIVEQTRNALQEAQTIARKDRWQRVHSHVIAMAKKLSAYVPGTDDKRPEGIFRDSLVNNLKTVVDLIPRLMTEDDSELDNILSRVTRELLVTDAETLREVDSVRLDIASKAKAIANDMAEFMA